LTKRYTEEAVKFIHAHKKEPFFLYLPHTMPHLPMAASKDFSGRTKTLFGDVMEEIDWSVGQVLNALKESGVDDRTLVIFTTDNGTRSGSSGPLRGHKAQLYEGGYRVPCIVRWPGHVPAGSVCREIAATIDMLPTIAAITGGTTPDDRKIDGHDIRPLLFGEEGAKTPHEYYILAHDRGAVRSGNWKFYPWAEGPKKQTPGVQLYDLASDLGETKNIAADHPDVVERLTAAYQAHVSDLKKNQRPAPKVKP
jgi:arylsulfatase A